MSEENIVLCPQWLCSKPSKVKIVESKPSFPSHRNIINWCEYERETKTTLKINLEQQLLKIGNRLFQPPSSISQLLWLLTKTDHLLCKVNQDPCASMQAALSPIMKALIAKEFLQHSDCDVRVAVASCLSELTRITAPDFPYNDDQMVEVFQVIVSSFENLSDTSSPSYGKRVKILNTFASVKSCLIMLDLECEESIVQMFWYFLKEIKDHHLDNIFRYMEQIMTLVLEESDHISVELLRPLLASVRKENQTISPESYKLGEKVLNNCATILKSCLSKALQSMALLSIDFAEIVAYVCQDESEKENFEYSHISPVLAKEEKVTNDVPHVTYEEVLDSTPPKFVNEIKNGTIEEPPTKLPHMNVEQHTIALAPRSYSFDVLNDHTHPREDVELNETDDKFAQNEITQDCIEEIGKLHKSFTAIVSNKDVKYNSNFGKTLWIFLGTNLKFLFASCPLNDRKIEVVNQGLGKLVSFITSMRLDTWNLFLPIMEYVYTSLTNQSTGSCSFEIIYHSLLCQSIDYNPSPPCMYSLEFLDSFIQLVHDFHTDMRQEIVLSKKNYELVAYAHHRNHEFNEDDYAIICALPQPCHKNSFQIKHAKIDRLCHIIQKSGPNAYFFDWSLDMSTSSIFDVEYLLPNRGTFEPPILLACVPTGEFTFSSAPLVHLSFQSYYMAWTKDIVDYQSDGPHLGDIDYYLVRWKGF